MIIIVYIANIVIEITVHIITNKYFNAMHTISTCCLCFSLSYCSCIRICSLRAFFLAISLSRSAELSSSELNVLFNSGSRRGLPNLLNLQDML